MLLVSSLTRSSATDTSRSVWTSVSSTSGIQSAVRNSWTGWRGTLLWVQRRRSLVVSLHFLRIWIATDETHLQSGWHWSVSQDYHERATPSQQKATLPRQLSLSVTRPQSKNGISSFPAVVFHEVMCLICFHAMIQNIWVYNILGFGIKWLVNIWLPLRTTKMEWLTLFRY